MTFGLADSDVELDPSGAFGERTGLWDGAESERVSESWRRGRRAGVTTAGSHTQDLLDEYWKHQRDFSGVTNLIVETSLNSVSIHLTVTFGRGVAASRLESELVKAMLEVGMSANRAALTRAKSRAAILGAASSNPSLDELRQATPRPHRVRSFLAGALTAFRFRPAGNARPSLRDDQVLLSKAFDEIDKAAKSVGTVDVDGGPKWPTSTQP